MINMKNQYLAPAVLRRISFLPEGDVLTTSIVNTLDPIVSKGQDVEHYNFSSDNTFNHNWE